MTSEDTPETEQVSLSNHIINLANSAIEDGHAVEDIAESIRHAAANFSAYAFFRSEQSPKDPNHTVENFISLFEYYLDAHRPEDTSGQGLMQTIAQAKSEL
ncbi:MAG: DUF3144 domain-containing protein [Rhodospirillales bacterium]|nr:DUF3144 domain-containing protein [Rhodospirillales bacterium]